MRTIHFDTGFGSADIVPCAACGKHDGIYDAGRWNGRYEGYISCRCGTHLVIAIEQWNETQAEIVAGAFAQPSTRPYNDFEAKQCAATAMIDAMRITGLSE